MSRFSNRPAAEYELLRSRYDKNKRKQASQYDVLQFPDGATYYLHVSVSLAVVNNTDKYLIVYSVNGLSKAVERYAGRGAYAHHLYVASMSDALATGLMLARRLAESQHGHSDEYVRYKAVIDAIRSEVIAAFPSITNGMIKITCLKSKRAAIASHIADMTDGIVIEWVVYG